MSIEKTKKRIAKPRGGIAGGRVGEKLPHLSIDEAGAFKTEIEQYLDRTKTAAGQLGLWARGYASSIYFLQKNPIPTIAVADHFRRAMAEHPEGAGKKEPSIRKSEGNHNASAQARVKSEQIIAMRADRREKRAAHIAACHAAHLKRYGPDAIFGNSLRQMRA
jgi:hypothetical protein